MEPPRSEKALRRLVADLAGLRPEDVDAVLDNLSAEHRATVRGLLDGYSGRPAMPSAPAAPAPVAENAISTGGFSWPIARRLDPKSPPPARPKRARAQAEASDWSMTDASLQALRACAKVLPPPAAPPAVVKRPQWFTRRGLAGSAPR